MSYRGVGIRNGDEKQNEFEGFYGWIFAVLSMSMMRS